jgi:gliding motility-associated-like protein
MASGQLQRWPVRGVDGVRMMDLTTPVPTVGPLITGFGTGGEEDVNAMTDAAGNLLFCNAVSSANEIRVLDANLNQMPNGFGLNGHSSTLQSAICPIPCHPDRYYVFHLLTGAGDLFYSIVDMSLNGGLGDVTQKNVLIGTGFTEGMAISHQLNNGCRWLFSSVRNGPAYEVVRCLISQTGIGPPTVIASVSPNGTVYNFNEIELSPDNTRLAMSVFTTAPTEPDIVVWDLALQTGTLTNQQGHSVSSDPINGIQFSPAGGYVYFVGNGNNDAMDFGRVQVPGGAVDIIDANMGRYLTMTELAGNGRIYVAMNYNHDYMAEVAFPDAPALAGIGYNHDAVFITAAGCRPPLPNAIEGEPPGSTTTPGFIEFTAIPQGSCDTYLFVDSTCLGTWWEWDLGDGTVTNDPTPLHTYSAGVYDVTLRVVACGDTLTLIKPAYITANSAPIDAMFSMPPAVCVGDAISFINTSIGATAYEWSFGDGGTSTDAEPSHAFTASGQYTVTLVAGSTCLSDTMSATITIEDGADASFEVDGDPCTGLIQFNNTSTAGSSWSWDFGDGTTSALPSPTHLFAPGSYDVMLIGAPGSACADTAMTVVTVDEAPIAVFSTTTGCDQTVVLTDLSTGAVSWIWDFGDGSFGNTPDTTHAFASPGDYDITLTVTSASGCQVSAVQSVSVEPAPLASISVLGDSCQTTFTFDASASSASTVTWQFGDGSSATGFNPTHTYASFGAYVVTLIADPGSACADTLTAAVNALQPPEAEFTAVTDCGMQVNLTSQSILANTLNWNLGDGTFAADPSLTHGYADPGDYIITLVAYGPNGCSDTAAFNISIGADPIASFEILGDSCSNERTFMSTSVWTSGYSWQFGDGGTSVLESPTHAFGIGSFTVLLIADPGSPCADSAWAVVEISQPPLAAFSDSTGCHLDVHLEDQSQFSSSVLWNYGDGEAGTSAVHDFASPGTYEILLVATNELGCTDTASAIITIQAPATASFSASMEPCTQELRINNSSTGAASFNWSFGDGAVSVERDPDHDYIEGGSYIITLIAGDANGCADTASVEVDASFAGIAAGYFVPNVFTPNGDEINDVFQVVGPAECQGPSIRIFNRWGEQVFESAGNEPWDGTVAGQMAPDGIYVYILEFAQEEVHGHVALLR